MDEFVVVAGCFPGDFERCRSENVEVFQKRRAAQEAAYRTKVHEGRETLKKTSQVIALLQ